MRLGQLTEQVIAMASAPEISNLLKELQILRTGRFQPLTHTTILVMVTLEFVVLRWICGKRIHKQQHSLLTQIQKTAKPHARVMMVVAANKAIAPKSTPTEVVATSMRS